jgi:hypothetical protein
MWHFCECIETFWLSHSWRKHLQVYYSHQPPTIMKEVGTDRKVWRLVIREPRVRMRNRYVRNISKGTEFEYCYCCCHRLLMSHAFLPGTSLEPSVISTAQASSFTLQYVPQYVSCSKYSCLLKWIYWMFSWYDFQYFPFLLLFRWLQLLTVLSHISGFTFVVFLYINFCILASFPFPFARHLCLQVLPHLSVCMFSLFYF